MLVMVCKFIAENPSRINKFLVVTVRPKWELIQLTISLRINPAGHFVIVTNAASSRSTSNTASKALQYTEYEQLARQHLKHSVTQNPYCCDAQRST
jgi:hypothetical protein